MKHIKNVPTFFVLSIVVITLSFSCKEEPPRKEVALYNQYCASCHLAPKIDNLPKHIWKNNVLPDMLTRMKIDEEYEDPTNKVTAYRPTIKLKDWVALKNYIIELAPDSLEATPIPETNKLTLFEERAIAVDTLNGANITFLDHTESDQLFYGTLSGELYSYDVQSNFGRQYFKGQSPVTWYNKNEAFDIVTEVGILDPSTLQRGKLVKKRGLDTTILKNGFYRPVNTLLKDLNDNGQLEMVVSEFGDATGMLSLMVKNKEGGYDKTVLLNQPGCIITIAKDVDSDGRLDLVTITSQGNESITILYQGENLKFKAEKVLEFPSIYGSSWFEMLDYNGDGLDDIITVNGDNADKSYVQKPYHGLRIHLNQGNMTFEEAFFYPLNGATRFVANDFDQDGDIDFGVVSTFPDYEKAPHLTFVYLENKNAPNFEFETKILNDPNAGRWFLMDASDIDADGDDDIILSSFTYVFTPVPDDLSERWSNENVDIIILKNSLF